jgi:hypothetical protein
MVTGPTLVSVGGTSAKVDTPNYGDPKFATGDIVIGSAVKSMVAPVSTVSVIADNAGTYTVGAVTLKINGHAATAAYNATKNQTLTDLAAAIAAADVVNVATAVYSSVTHTITITANTNKLVVVSDLVLTAITGTMTMVVNQSGANGDCYIAPATANGWTINRKYTWEAAAWVESLPVTGEVVWVSNQSRDYKWSGTAWVASVMANVACQLTTSAVGVSSPMYNRTKEGLTSSYDRQFNVY